jgi:hypothetical protein
MTINSASSAQPRTTTHRGHHHLEDFDLVDNAAIHVVGHRRTPAHVAPEGEHSMPADSAEYAATLAAITR